jgi:dienelactone hydrolase
MRPSAFEDDLSRRLDEAQPSLLFEGTTPDDLSAWQQQFKSRLMGLLGNQPERGPLELEWREEEDCGPYTRHRVAYQSEPGVSVPAFVLIPNDIEQGDKRPGLLCLHGHGRFGKDSVVGIDDAPERAAEIREQRCDYGHRLASDGYVVLAPDLRGFGERSLHYPDGPQDYCYRNYMVATLLGTTVVALNLCDLHAALDVLTLLDHVDDKRLGCVGLSLGGRMTMTLAALDDRISIAVPSGCMNLFQERYQALHQCGSQLIPGLIQYGDTPEIFSLIAPRPMVLEIGSRDPLIPEAWKERGLARLKKAYEAAGAEDRLYVDLFDGEHEFHGNIAFDVLGRWGRGEID